MHLTTWSIQVSRMKERKVMTNHSVKPGVYTSPITTKKDQKEDEVNEGHSCMKCMGCMNVLIPDGGKQ